MTGFLSVPAIALEHRVTEPRNLTCPSLEGYLETKVRPQESKGRAEKS